MTLSQHHGEIDSTGPAPVLRFTVRAQSHVRAPVDSVYLGIIFAASPADLAGADPSRLYAKGPALGERLGVIKELAPVSLAAGGEATLVLTFPLGAGQPSPQAFFVHVLGYGLADADAALLFGLLETESPSDEAAAVDAMGLKADRAGRQAARLRWSKKPLLTRDLVLEATRPVPERPSEAETFRRVFAARALGVLGGGAAERALKRLLADPGLGRFDEPLQVLRIARVIGSDIETPLAFVVPAQAQSMAELVATALAEVNGLTTAVPAGGEAPPALEAPPRAASAYPADADSLGAGGVPVAPVPPTLSTLSAAAPLQSPTASADAFSWQTVLAAAAASSLGMGLAFAAMRGLRRVRGRAAGDDGAK